MPENETQSDNIQHASTHKSTPVCLELERYIDELHEDYEIWYARSVRKTFRWWWFLQVVSLLSGFAFALLAALTAADVLGENLNVKKFTVIALVALPALSALAANTLIQFRVYDLWRLRERGRISFQNLVVEGRWRIRSSATEQDCIKIFTDLQQKAYEIEFGQSESFFAFNDSGTVATYNSNNKPMPKSNDASD